MCLRLYDRGGVLQTEHVLELAKLAAASDTPHASPHNFQPVALVALPFAGGGGAGRQGSGGAPSAARAVLVLRCGDARVVDMTSTSARPVPGTPCPRLITVFRCGQEVGLAAAVMPDPSGAGRRLTGQWGGLVLACTRPPEAGQEDASPPPAADEGGDGDDAAVPFSPIPVSRPRRLPTLFFFDGSCRANRPVAELSVHSEGGVSALVVRGRFLITAGRLAGEAQDPALRAVDLSTLQPAGNLQVLPRSSTSATDPIAWLAAGGDEGGSNQAGAPTAILVGTHFGSVRTVEMYPPAPGNSRVTAQSVGTTTITSTSGGVSRFKAPGVAMSPTGEVLVATDMHGMRAFLTPPDVPSVSVGPSVAVQGRVEGLRATALGARLLHPSLPRHVALPPQHPSALATLTLPEPGMVAPQAAMGIHPEAPVLAHALTRALPLHTPPPAVPLAGSAALMAAVPLLTAKEAAWGVGTFQPTGAPGLQALLPLNAPGSALPHAVTTTPLLPLPRQGASRVVQRIALGSLPEQQEEGAAPPRRPPADSAWLPEGVVAHVSLRQVAAGGSAEMPDGPPVRLRPNSHVYGQSAEGVSPHLADIMRATDVRGGVALATPASPSPKAATLAVPTRFAVPKPAVPRFGWTAYDASELNRHPILPCVLDVGQNTLLAQPFLLCQFTRALRQPLRRATPTCDTPLLAEVKGALDISHALSEGPPSSRLLSPIGVVRAARSSHYIVGAGVLAPGHIYSPLRRLPVAMQAFFTAITAEQPSLAAAVDDTLGLPWRDGDGAPSNSTRGAFLQYAKNAPYAHARGAEARDAAIEHSFPAALSRGLAVDDVTRVWRRFPDGSLARQAAGRTVTRLPPLLLVDCALQQEWQREVWTGDGWLPTALDITLSSPTTTRPSGEAGSYCVGGVKVSRADMGAPPPHATPTSTSTRYHLVGVVSFVGPFEAATCPPSATPASGTVTGGSGGTPPFMSPGMVAALARGGEGPGHFVLHARLSEAGEWSGDAGGAWWLWNSLSVTPSSAGEAVDFSAAWRHPVALLWAHAAGVDTPDHPAPGQHPLHAVWSRDEPSAPGLSLLRCRPSQFATNLPGGEDDEAAWSAQVQHAEAYLASSGPAPLVALDAEFVTVMSRITAPGPNGPAILRPAVERPGRVSVVGGDGATLLDTFIVCEEAVQDYWTRFSGIREGDLNPATSTQRLTPLPTVLLQLRALVACGAVFVGHGVAKDFFILNLHVPPQQVVDTAQLWRRPGERIFKLRFLAAHLLGQDIQDTEHDSTQDARTALDLLHKYLAVVDVPTLPAGGAGDLPTPAQHPALGGIVEHLYSEGRRSGFKVAGGASALASSASTLAALRGGAAEPGDADSDSDEHER